MEKPRLDIPDLFKEPALCRRDVIKTLGVGFLACSTGLLTHGTAWAQASKEGGTVPYELTPLPYDYDALEPGIEEKVLRIHHDKHHAGYVKGLKATLAKLKEAREASDYSRIKSLSRDLAFHGSGHILHHLYWHSMKPKGSKEPDGELRDLLDRDFGSFSGFHGHFGAAAKKVEGSGWAVLGFEPMGKQLVVLQVEKHQNLTFWGVVPLLVCDVWEHAYYDQYQNRRGEYVDNYLKLIDWAGVARRLAAVIK